MKARILRLAAAIAVATVPAPVGAQHEGHQVPATPATAVSPAQCAQAQPAVENIIAAATARLESARQSNDPAQLRAAVDHLQGALRDLKTQLAPCTAAAAAADPHAGHAMPATPPAAADPHAGHAMPAKPAAPKTAPPAKSAAPSKPKPAADPHAGHTMPAKPAAPKAAPPKPATPKPAVEPKPDPHAGHQMPAPPAGKQRDPVTGLMVDPATASKTTYQGVTYYFSSEQSLKEFLQNPAKFAKKPKG